ncbi:transcriptional regulator [Gottschalkia purinilytica]|uniref:Transcriptional regulator n=1 Tax=Gottschalkia purinilytica TaxID=1503 RepID=A0A0L0WBZ6_GOTPU|nr:MarR family transcriptional regulator [Gottschalkia purinilytica]KNF08996.1 transcriptional regulator [Gottschalkia purinilytica]
MTEKTNKVIGEFIKMVEKISNGKTNILDFGSEDMCFYRGEIHMIKLIGDAPGVYISEMARNLNITRAVVSKTIMKLEKRGLIEKVEDEEDKKRLKLYLTSKGQEAYRLHNEYHQKYDKPLFEYVDSLNEKELKIIENFLKKASDLVDNHF